MARNTIVPGIFHSTFKTKVLDLLTKTKFVAGYEITHDGPKKFITVQLNPITNMNENIPNIKFFSKPSRKIYISYKEIKTVAGGKWFGIISTNQWLLSTHIAKSLKVGGELIAEIY